MRIELRSDSVILDGYVNVTQRESRILPSPRGNFVEEIKPRTFERALMKTDSVDLLFNHDPGRKLGSTKEGNVRLHEDNVGLRATATVTDSDVMEKARKGELRGWSFGFSVIKDEWRQREDGMQKRFVEDIDLFEISVLDITPAYIATSIEARGEDKTILNETRSEEFQATIEDSAENGHKSDKTDKNTGQEEARKDSSPEPHYYENLANELSVMQIKGGF